LGKNAAFITAKPIIIPKKIIIRTFIGPNISQILKQYTIYAPIIANSEVDAPTAIEYGLTTELNIFPPMPPKIIKRRYLYH